MKTQVKQPEALSHTIQGKNRASKQASVESVLQKMESKTVESVELKMESENPLSTLNSQFSTNETGIPDTMKANFENFSGFSFDDVRVHYNSPKPAQLQALAYTQGNQVHIAPGQEKHLGHELGHVVQQKQGRVQPTMQLQGVNVNDNEGLEREAETFGKVMQLYRPDAAPQITADERKQIQEVKLALSSIRLENGQFFHCTTKKNYNKEHGIIDDGKIRSCFGGQRGAGDALGNNPFATQDVGYAFASTSPGMIAEYYELHLARSIMNNDSNLRPIILLLEAIGVTEADPAEDVGAFRTRSSFRVVKKITVSPI